MMRHIHDQEEWDGLVAENPPPETLLQLASGFNDGNMIFCSVESALRARVHFGLTDEQFLSVVTRTLLGLGFKRG